MSDLRQDLGIFGIGSEQGMDTLGWAALEYLRPALAEHPAAGRIQWHTCRTPVDMLTRWEGLEQVILLDALPVATDSAVCRLMPQELEAAGGLSSHGWGVSEVVRLAAALGLEPRLCILGLVVGPRMPQRPDDWLLRYGPALLQAAVECLSDTSLSDR